MNKAVLVLLLCYGLLQSSCSDMVLRTVQVGDRKMKVVFYMVELEGDTIYNSLNKRRLSNKEMKSFRPYTQSPFYIYLPQSPHDTVVVIKAEDYKRTARKEDFSVYYNLGKITKTALKRAIGNKLKGNLSIRRIELKALSSAGVEHFLINKLKVNKWHNIDEVSSFIDRQPNNTKIVMDIAFVTVPPKVIGGIDNLCVLTLVD